MKYCLYAKGNVVQPLVEFTTFETLLTSVKFFNCVTYFHYKDFDMNLMGVFAKKSVKKTRQCQFVYF